MENRYLLMEERGGLSDTPIVCAIYHHTDPHPLRGSHFSSEIVRGIQSHRNKS